MLIQTKLIHTITNISITNQRIYRSRWIYYSNALASITPVPQSVSRTDKYGIWMSIDCSGSVCGIWRDRLPVWTAIVYCGCTVTAVWTAGSAMCASSLLPTCRCGPLCNAVHMLTVAAVLSVTCYAYVVRARLLPYSRGAMEACVTRVTVRRPGVI